jgi:hypothetical protein
LFPRVDKPKIDKQMAFLPGLLATLGPMLPGIVSTIGDIAGKVFNRPAGKGIGETLLEAAPTALKAVSGIASSLAPGLGGTAGKVLGTIGSVANALTPAPGQSAENRAGYEKGIAPYKLGDTRENNANYELAGSKFDGPANTREFANWLVSNDFENDNHIRRIPGYYNEMAQARTPADMRRVVAKWSQIVSDNPLTPWNEPAITPEYAKAEAEQRGWEQSVEMVDNIIASPALKPFWKWAEKAWPSMEGDIGTYTYPLMKDQEFHNEILRANPKDYPAILTKWLSKDNGPPGIPYGSAVSTSATDHMPIVHGPATQAQMPMIGAQPSDRSGPMALQGISPAQAYQNDSKQTAGPTAMSGNERFMLPKTQYDRDVGRSFSPEVLVNYKGERAFPVQRTQVESFGSSPSFNPFANLAPRPVEVQQAIANTMPPALDNRDELLLKAARIITKRTVKKAAKKQKKRGRK